MKVLVPFLVAIVLASPASAQPFDTARIEQLTGAKGKLDEKEGVFKVSVPRTDLAVTAEGVTITPSMGLTAWAAFHRSGPHAMVMGDIVLTEAQVSAVLDAALGNGLEVTALHNHFLNESPRIMFMHVGGSGDEATLAAAIGKVFSAMRETGRRPAISRATLDPAAGSPPAKEIDAVFGKSGELTNGVYKLTFGRATTMHGESVGNAMGVNTWAAFAGSAERAVLAGDFAMLETELQDVLKALRAAKIDVVAIHQHMAGESPRILFLHFWGIGKAVDLARGVKAALGKTATR